MCGIFGINKKKLHDNNLSFDKMVRDLFILSESRGKEASGLAAIIDNNIEVLKVPFQASKFIKTKEFNQTIERIKNQKNQFQTLFGHARLVTNGYEHFEYNNQPVVTSDTVLIHNGIITNYNEIFKNELNTKGKTDLDSEVLPLLFEKYFNDTIDLNRIITKMYSHIYGMTTFTLFNKKLNNLIIATNNGSLYYYNSEDLFIFASEYYFLIDVLQKNKFNYKHDEIIQLKPNTCIIVNIDNNKHTLVNLFSDSQINVNFKKEFFDIKQINTDYYKNVKQNKSLEHNDFQPSDTILKHFENAKKQIHDLKRCTKCLLPDTFPYIQFNDDGVCNYCLNYKKIETKGVGALNKIIEKHCDINRSPNVLIPFSGGRDSSYVLHFIKKELGLNPIAFSYDWGMITDLARRNQARLCGKLGVEHILISADIRKKRNNIKLNVEAWLKRPSLGTIPLFMAGDKKYFYYSNQIMKSNNLKISVLGENLLETTKFKSGFCGIKPNFEGENTYNLSFINKLQMLGYYGKEYLLNPAYLNSSIIDTMDAFKSYYVIDHETINLFNYLDWDENEIIDTIDDNYEWETDPETKTTWRIGDGTAAFYNYIYYMVAGFTENDTFRSNQIREGKLNRDEALKLVAEENQARWKSIKWYCDTIDIDFDRTINIINKIPKLYE